MIDQYPSQNGVLTSLIWRKTAAGGETSLSGYDNASQALSYTPGQEQVYLNGILLVRGDDYTATNGTSITGLAALSASDFVQVNCYNNFSVATLPVSGLVGSVANNQLQNSSITVNGSSIPLGGSVTVAASDHNHDSVYINQSTFDAKGDLIVGAADNSYAKLAASTEQGATLVADSSTSTGLRWGNNYGFTAGKNKIINGDFRINQRSFTSTAVDATYMYDRWRTYINPGAGSATFSAQTFTPGAAPVAGYEAVNFIRCVTASISGASTYAVLAQHIEDVRTFAGQTITVSFWAKAGSGTPSVSSELIQNFGSGGSTRYPVPASVKKYQISTSWVRYSFSFTLDSISGKTIGTNSYLEFYIWLSAGADFNNRTDTLGVQNNTFDIWGVQVENGNVATAFQTATGTLAGELAACQRYYYRMTGGGSVPLLTTNGISWSTTRSNIIIQNPVRMRTTPTLIEFANLNATDLVNYNLAVSGLTIDTLCSTPDFFFFDATHAATATVNRQAFLRGSSSAGYIGVGAEL